jgi:hypothetical protein
MKVESMACFGSLCLYFSVSLSAYLSLTHAVLSVGGFHHVGM